MAEIEEYFVDSGARPGFPGNHGPGWYLVDYVARTIRPKPLEQGVELAQEEEASVAHSDANREVPTPEPEMQPVEEAQPEQEGTEPEGTATL